MFGFRGQILTNPDVALRRQLRLSPGPIFLDKNGIKYVAYDEAEPPNLSGSTSTLTESANRHIIINPAGDRTIKLPSAGIKKGEYFRIVSKHVSRLITIQASDGTDIDYIYRGYAVIEAETDDPSGTADWRAEEIYEQYTHQTSTDHWAAADPDVNIYLRRHNNNIFGRVTAIGNQTKPDTTAPHTTVAFPSRFQPAQNIYAYSAIKDNAAWEAGNVIIQTNGFLTWAKGSLGAWTSGALAACQSASWAHPRV